MSLALHSLLKADVAIDMALKLYMYLVTLQIIFF